MKKFLIILVIIAGLILAGLILDPSPIDDPNSYHANGFEWIGRYLVGIGVIIGAIFLINRINKK